MKLTKLLALWNWSVSFDLLPLLCSSRDFDIVLDVVKKCSNDVFLLVFLFVECFLPSFTIVSHCFFTLITSADQFVYSVFLCAEYGFSRNWMSSATENLKQTSHAM